MDNNGSNDVTFQYDALGRRVARQGTSGSFVYVQHDQQTIADYGYGDAPSSPTHRYVYASYIDEPVVRKAAGTSGTIYYLHRNQQYSITAVTTSSGSVAERYAYTAYGQPTILDASGSVLSSSAINNRYTYTGREWDQTLGLYHFRARWVIGLAGRFLSRDPIDYSGGENLYRYVYSSPMSRVDPSGLLAIAEGKPKQAVVSENACKCCCCPTKITATAVPTSHAVPQGWAQSVTITISVTMTYSKAPAGAKNTGCGMALLEFIDPDSTDELSPFFVSR